MRLRPPTIFSTRWKIVISLTIVILAISFAYPVQQAHAYVNTVQSQVKAVSAVTGQPDLNSWSSKGCTFNGFYYSIYDDLNTGIVYYISSPDGVTWTAPVALFTMTAYGGAGDSASNCNKSILIIGWTDTTLGAAKWRVDIATCLLNAGAITNCTTITGWAVSTNVNLIHCATSSNVVGVNYNDDGTVLLMVGPCPTLYDIVWGTVATNGGMANQNGSYSRAEFAMAGSTYVTFTTSGGTPSFLYSANGVNWNGPTTLTNPFGGVLEESYFSSAVTVPINGLFPTGSGKAYLYFGATGAAAGCGSGCLAQFIITPAGTVTSQLIVSVGNTLSTTQIAGTTDENGNALAMYYPANAATGFVSLSINDGQTWGAASTFSSAGTAGQQGVAPVFTGSMASFVVGNGVSSAGAAFYTQVFGSIQLTSGAVGVQTIGACPTKNTATFTMVNQTMYMYEGSTLTNEVVSTVQVNIASVGGTTGTHTVQLVIYATPSAGSISVSNLLTLVYSHQVALTSGSKNQQIILSVTGLNFATTGATWGIGIIGDNKVALNQSSLGGMFSFSGVPVSTSPQNSFFTTQGAAFGTDLALCATASFQSVITQTVTITQSATTSVTVTSTSTVNTINAQVLFANNQNWPIVFLLLFLPCGILLGVTRNLSGGMVGLLIGSVICLMAGVIPAYIFTGLLIGIVAMMVLIQRSGPNG